MFHELSSILYLIMPAGNKYMALIYVSGVTIASINFFSKYLVCVIMWCLQFCIAYLPHYVGVDANELDWSPFSQYSGFSCHGGRILLF